ncbi:hypothetical protein H4R33_000328 [Dimargaris cristalligena]|nr:hypothetical protein H4R33_000328 [Dimargaris cristalligena]
MAMITTGNCAALCLKHYMSKMCTFGDLTTMWTYGFCGEALSSFCTLAHVTVTPAMADLSLHGVQLSYTSTGVLKSQMALGPEVGTMIMLSQLFAQWPVWYMQFKKTIRWEYARCMAVLEAYGALSKQVMATQMVFQSNGKPL